MSRARHRAKGGSAKEHAKPVVEAGKGTEALKEAEERKHGGALHHDPKVKHHLEGEHTKPRHDRRARARGGAVPGRKRGGGIGADRVPLSSAAKVQHVTRGEGPEHGEPSD
jgi:hypothetical protein